MINQKNWKTRRRLFIVTLIHKVTGYLRNVSIKNEPQLTLGKFGQLVLLNNKVQNISFAIVWFYTLQFLRGNQRMNWSGLSLLKTHTVVKAAHLGKCFLKNQKRKKCLIEVQRGIHLIIFVAVVALWELKILLHGQVGLKHWLYMRSGPSESDVVHRKWIHGSAPTKQDQFSWHAGTRSRK